MFGIVGIPAEFHGMLVSAGFTFSFVYVAVYLGFD